MIKRDLCINGYLITPEAFFNSYERLINSCACAEGQNAVAVDAATEDDVLAMAFLEFGQVGHGSSRRLDGVENVDADFDEVID